MEVYLLQDVPRVGIAGEIIKVSDGYAHNFLLPRKKAVAITEKNRQFYADRVKKVEHRKEVLESETSMAAEKIKNTEIILKHKVHDSNKLYNAVSAPEIVDALAKESISISKSQVLINKSIKTTGTHKVTIKLSSRLKPTLTVKVVKE